MLLCFTVCLKIKYWSQTFSISRALINTCEQKKVRQRRRTTIWLCVCVCVWESGMCVNITHLCMDHFWPETRPEPSNRLRLSPSPCCARSSPGAAAESHRTEEVKDLKTKRRREEERGERVESVGVREKMKRNSVSKIIFDTLIDEF